MENQDDNAQPGEIMEELQNLMYRVQLDDGPQVKAHLSSLLKKVTVRLLPGERVLVNVSAFDTSRAKITKRLPKVLPV
jgi:translation initiation factor IF-1